MTWHLKNRQLEAKLIAIDPDFVKNLTEIVEENLELTNGWFNDESVTDIEINSNGHCIGELSFYTDTLEEVHEYNPKAWNEYPKVKPPYGVMMRADFTGGKNGYKAFYKHFEEGDCWCHADGTVMPKTYSDAIERFRPWDD